MTDQGKAAAPSMEDQGKAVPHLTHVERRPETSKATPWQASCDCGWSDLFRLKAQAITGAELHWLAYPVVMRRD